MTLRQRQASQTRQLLLEAAARVFARRGYSRATIDDVAAEAGASKGAVYHHFASKRALFQALMAHRAAGLEPLRALAEGAESLPELVDGLVELWLARMRDLPEAVVLSLEARLQAIRDPEAAALLGGYYCALRDALDELLQAAAQRFACTLPRRQPALVVFGMLDGICQQWAMDPDHADPEDLREVLTGTLMDFLGTEPKR
ncbi:TetR/AcrR family transcriptional regulator [Streptomyces sp. NPDC002851]